MTNARNKIVLTSARKLGLCHQQMETIRKKPHRIKEPPNFIKAKEQKNTDVLRRIP